MSELPIKKAPHKKASKTELEKALQERLSVLTDVLTMAEVGNKGIELVKEIKELHSLLLSLRPQQESKPSPSAAIRIGWNLEAEKHMDASMDTKNTLEKKSEK